MMDIGQYSFTAAMDELIAAVRAYKFTYADGKSADGDFDANLRALVRFILQAVESGGGKIICMGNGGSAAISSHAALDFWNACGIPAIAFTDSAMLTCAGNDYGYENVYSKPMEMFAASTDVVLAVSSSGKSKNILNAVTSARATGCKVVTFSGFSPQNPLRKMGDVNVYVPSSSYGHVEVAHGLLLHAASDCICNVSAGRVRLSA